MARKLVVAILGNRNAGKSSTWYELFGGRVKTGTGTRSLFLTKSHYIEDVFLVNGSPEERDESIENIIGAQQPTVVLCSTQYVINNKTLQYFINEGYDLYVQWLNPGFEDPQMYGDKLGLIDSLLQAGATLVQCDGSLPTTERITQIRQFIFGWASARNLINIEF